MTLPPRVLFGAPDADAGGARFCYVGPARSKADLLAACCAAVNAALPAPNWDALHDVLRGLGDWIKNNTVHLVHDASITSFSPRELSIYLGILDSTCRYFQAEQISYDEYAAAQLPNSMERAPTLNVWFPDAAREACAAAWELELARFRGNG